MPQLNRDLRKEAEAAISGSHFMGYDIDNTATCLRCPEALSEFRYR
jgi:hypothetical protein